MHADHGLQQEREAALISQHNLLRRPLAPCWPLGTALSASAGAVEFVEYGTR